MSIKADEMPTPSDKLLSSPETAPEVANINSDDKVKMKKELGLLEGVAIILGVILGSGKNLLI